MRLLSRFAALLGVLVLLEGAAGFVILHQVTAATDMQEMALTRSAEVVVACERLAGHANREAALVLGSFRGASALEEVNATRDAFAADVASARALVAPGSPVDEQITRMAMIEGDLFEGATDAGSLFDVITRASEAKQDILEKNAKHRVRTTGFMTAFGSPATNLTMTRVLAEIESERVAILEFEPAIALGASEADRRVNRTFELNTAIVAKLTAEAAREVDDQAGELERIADSRPELREEALGTSRNLRALAEALARTTAVSDENATGALFERVEQNVSAAAPLGLVVPRADVPQVGDDVTPVTTLGKIVTCQQGLRQSANVFFNSTLALQSILRDSLGPRADDLKAATVAVVDIANREAQAAHEEADAQLARARLLVGATLVGIVVPVGGLGALVARHHARRIRSFDAAAEAVSRGRFDSPPPPLARDEFDPLAKAWASMTEALRERDHELAHKGTILRQSERMATLGSLVAGVAHEVNNPLAFVLSNEDMALSDVRDLLARPDVAAQPEVVAALQSIQSGIEANLDGIRRIQSMNRALKGFAGPVRQDREDFDLNEVVDGVLIIAHNRLKSRYIVEKRYGQLPRLVGAPQEIGQVVLNLLINAADASPEGGTIAIETRTEGDHVLLTVRDSGVGVSPDIRDRLFQPFATGKEDGTGLGLYISRTIAEAHKGALDLDETDPARGGATFTLRLPRETQEVIASKPNGTS